MQQLFEFHPKRIMRSCTQVVMPGRHHVAGVSTGPASWKSLTTSKNILGRPCPRQVHAAPIKSMSNDDNPKEQAGFSREARPPNEDVQNAAKEMRKEQGLAGSHATDPNPMGGAGLEPPQADGEGQGYSMREVAEKGEGGDNGDEEAGVQDVE